LGGQQLGPGGKGEGDFAEHGINLRAPTHGRWRMAIQRSRNKLNEGSNEEFMEFKSEEVDGEEGLEDGSLKIKAK
jgi:hypothetical protein